jgi:hypothetical protein
MKANERQCLVVRNTRGIFYPSSINGLSTTTASPV